MSKQPVHRTIVAASLFAAGCIGAGSVLAATDTAANDNTETMTAPAATASSKQGSDYGNPADAKKVAPSREQVQQEAHRPSSAVLDDNAQREHDPDTAANRDANPTAGTTRNGRIVDREGGSAAAPGSDSTSTPSGSDTTSAPSSNDSTSGSSTSGSSGSSDNSSAASGSGSMGSSDNSGMSSSQGASSDGTISQRDWNKIDANGDNLVSPEEMSSWLDQHRPAQGASQESSPSTQGSSSRQQ